MPGPLSDGYPDPFLLFGLTSRWSLQTPSGLAPLALILPVCVPSLSSIPPSLLPQILSPYLVTLSEAHSWTPTPPPEISSPMLVCVAITSFDLYQLFLLIQTEMQISLAECLWLTVSPQSVST